MVVKTVSLALQFAGKCVKFELVTSNPDTAAGFTQKLTKAITANKQTNHVDKHIKSASL